MTEPCTPRTFHRIIATIRNWQLPSRRMDRQHSFEFRYLAQRLTMRYRPRRFRSLFGVSLDTCVVLWKRISLVDLDASMSIQKRHLLWALHFLKVYPPEIPGSASWGVDPVTWNNCIRRALRLLQHSLPKVLLLDCAFLH